MTSMFIIKLKIEIVSKFFKKLNFLSFLNIKIFINELNKKNLIKYYISKNEKLKKYTIKTNLKLSYFKITKSKKINTILIKKGNELKIK